MRMLGREQMLRPIRKFGVLFAALLFLAGAIAAQDRYGGSMDAKEHGYQHGYRDGLQQGRADLSRNATHSFDSEDYRHADQGYDQRVRRTDADANAYANGSYQDVATDTGYRDGLQAGLSDLRQRKNFKPEKHEAYEDGKHGYRKEYGDKKLYKEQYRKGFLRGYEDAFNRKRR